MADYKVKWIVKDKSLIKFHDDNASYPIADGVEFDKVENGSDVVAEIKENIVVKIAIKDVKAEVKKDTKEVLETQKETQKEVVEKTKKEPEPKVKDEGVKENVVEEKSVTNKEEKKVEKVTEKKPAKVIKPVIWTILALSIPNSVVKFEEQPPEMTWYPITSDAKKAFKGLKRGDKVEIVIDKVDAESQAGQIYKKDGIIDATAIVKKEEPKVSEEKVVEPEAKKESGKVNVSESVSNTTNESIERQVAVKGGIELTMFEIKNGLTGGRSIEQQLKFYTKVCFEAMQEV